MRINHGIAHCLDRMQDTQTERHTEQESKATEDKNDNGHTLTACITSVSYTHLAAGKGKAVCAFYKIKGIPWFMKRKIKRACGNVFHRMVSKARKKSKQA